MKIVERILQFLLIAWLLIGQWLQMDTGLPDTGDFSRIMTVFTSGPVGIEPNWPDFNTQHDQWEQRFLHYWLPYWKLDFPVGFRLWQADFNSSAIWLWYPGVLINRLFYSQSVLYLPSVSLLPRLLLILFLLLVFVWIDQSNLSPARRVLLTITLGIPLALFLVNHNYLVYLNTFFTEPALMSFLFAFLAALIYLKRKPSVWRYVLCIVTLFLLSAGKASAVYWPFLGLWFIFPSKDFRASPARYLARYLILAAGLTILATLFTQPSAYAAKVNQYNSLFNGVLAFSRNAPARLAELEIPKAEACVGFSTWTDTGGNCFGKPQIAEKMSFRNTLYVALKEPLAILRVFKIALDSMQNISFKPYAIGDRAAGDNGPNLVDSGLNLWTRLKHNYFPAGYGLLLAWAFFVLLFGFARRKDGFIRELALVGLITSLAMIIDICVAVIGEGRTDIVKHLFFANYLFDLSAIAALNVLVMWILDNLPAIRTAAPLRRASTS